MKDMNKIIVDRIILLDGAVSTLEHTVDGLERSLRNSSTQYKPGLSAALSDTRIRLGRALSRRNRVISWHEHLFDEQNNPSDHVKGGQDA